MIKIVNGDLLLAHEQYIAHQCNCVSNYAAGLAKHMFTKFPYSDVYTKRLVRHNAGSIEVCGDGNFQRYVINMMAQIYPGQPKYDTGPDTAIARLQYFTSCLDKIANIPNIQCIAFPGFIGCGLGGGVWTDYLNIIEDFHLKYKVPTSIYYHD